VLKLHYFEHMSQTAEQRIAELEGVLKDKERRLLELKTERDEARDLAERMGEKVQDSYDMIDFWIEAFGMVQDDNGQYTLENWWSAVDQLNRSYDELVRKWNKFVSEYNAAVAARRRNVGRPPSATDAQREAVLKLRKRGLSLRAIAEETGLGLQAVRTVIDQPERRDRASIKHLERVYRDMGEMREWRSRKRVRDAIPRRIGALQEQSAELIKEAKGLK
jgi:hypothetical protein